MNCGIIFCSCSGFWPLRSPASNDYGRAGGEILEEPTCAFSASAPGSPGPLGVGCGLPTSGYGQGGGGGGGFFGGGAASNSGGGGGGSSFSKYSVVDQGYNLGDGYAVLKWDWVGPSHAPSTAPSTFMGPSRQPAVTAVTVPPQTFNFLGTAQKFKVPVNVTSLRVTLYGGSGGNSQAYKQYLTSGGRGAMTSSEIPVTPGEVFVIMVGSAGTLYIGGFNGGGDSANQGYSSEGGGGGGATDFRRSPYSLADRILIAGGGGGASGVDKNAGGDGGLNAKG